MSAAFDFSFPWALLLAPLALLPLLRGRREVLAFSYVAWLPRDRLGQWAGFLWRAVAMLAVLSIVLALAGPGRPQHQVMRTGQGAEILILMDRSRSMDERMLPSDWRSIDPLSLRLQAGSRGPQKSQVARDLLAKFVAERPHDRFSLMFFSAGPIRVVPFTQHDAVVQAGITAGGNGRGLSETDVGRALLAAIGEFDQRAYSGSRIIMLVSDGGAQLDDPTRRRIAAGLQRNRVALYWLYLRTFNGPTLDAPQPAVRSSPAGSSPELALHHFFLTLRTPYHAYQAEVPEDLARAIADVGHQQNLPLDFAEQIPRQDYGRYFIGVAAVCCLLLLVYRSLLLRSWV
jgi:mxaC protein